MLITVQPLVIINLLKIKLFAIFCENAQQRKKTIFFYLLNGYCTDQHFLTKQ